MGINKKFFAPRRSIEWNGEVVCEIRGVTPNDIARIMQENAGDLESVLQRWQNDKRLTNAISEGPDAGTNVASAINDNAAAIFNEMISLVPDLAAKIIAVAAEDPESAAHVRDNFVAPLQFDILGAIAEMTFINQEGFKKFLGNVMALVNLGGRNQRPQ